jgi:hypothetical protein
VAEIAKANKTSAAMAELIEMVIGEESAAKKDTSLFGRIADMRGLLARKSDKLAD